MRVAIEILEINRARIPATFTAIKERLSPVMGRDEISNALDTLTDWMIVDGHYDGIGEGRAGYCFEITQSALPRMDELRNMFRAGGGRNV